MTTIDINSWMLSLLDQLQQIRQRQLVTFQGPESWCDKQLRSLSALDPQTLVFSDRNPDKKSISFSRADTCLGGETKLVAMDLFTGFNPDVLCIAAGLVKAGGVLMLFSPAVPDWASIDDRCARWQQQGHNNYPLFVEYFFTALEKDSQTGILVTPESASLQIPAQASLQATPILEGSTDEQARALEQAQDWLDRNQPGIVLITADRGRGKSTWLGLLVKSVIDRGRSKVVVTAHSRQAVAQVLQLAPGVEFIAPDRLIETSPAADLVIVDEAAMIPQVMLRQLSRLYPRMVMATTTGGYEGTGQGFLLRFVTDLQVRELHRLYLQKPVRWCPGDNLENWMNHCLMLNEKSRDAPVVEDPDQACELLLITDPGNREHLSLLRQVYALLTCAHYRTRPSDLRMLMENPDLVLVVARIEDVVVGATLLNREGGLDAALCEQIFLGRRRPRGHLLAQMLTAQAGIAEFASYRGLRVQRIAVAEACRRRAIGAQMLNRAMQFAKQKKFDYVGASFALDPQTAIFWQHCGFALVHVSFATGKSSGNHSVAVLKPVGELVDIVMAQLQQRIQRQLATWMTQFLQSMEADQVCALLRYADYQADYSDLELEEVIAFAQGQKGFELCFASLQKFVMRQLAQSTSNPPQLLIEKAVQNRNWKSLQRESGSIGRAQLQLRLRSLVDALIKA